MDIGSEVLRFRAFAEREEVGAALKLDRLPNGTWRVTVTEREFHAGTVGAGDVIVEGDDLDHALERAMSKISAPSLIVRPPKLEPGWLPDPLVEGTPTAHDRLMTLVATPSTHDDLLELCRDFAYDQLPEGPLRDTSRACCELAYKLIKSLMPGRSPYGRKSMIALQKLLEAKDAFVRAAK